jgi:CheY-like chemotaxis protein
MDGLELTRKLKANEPTRSIAIVAFSGYSTETIEQEILDAGCDGYIAKPITRKS